MTYNMRREAPRTLYTLTPSYQGVSGDLFEVIVVDNGSQFPVGQHAVESVDSGFRYVELPPGNPSPAAALNHGVALSRAPAVALLIDGARMLSPGVIRYALQALRVHVRPVISTLGCHLGAKPQQQSVADGYDAAAEDALLESVPWQRNGYRLFDISCLAESSKHGVLSPLVESNALVMPRQLFDELGGLDERFTSPGGGLVNLDFYQRALALPDVQLVTLLGEASFHQVHGGVSTGTENRWREMCDEYQRIRGMVFDPYPRPWPRSDYLGQLSRSYLPWLKRALVLRRRFYAGFEGNPHVGEHAPSRKSFDQATRTVVVLGMHRSGTSLLTGTLQEAGLNLGNVVHAAPHNRKGNRESIAIRTLHEDLLQRSGGSWHQPPDSVEWSPVHQAMRDLIIAQFQGQSVWGFKDPRTVFCFEGWLEVLPQIQVVAIVRHPESVARSLQARDGFSLDQGFDLWLRYNLRLKFWLEQLPVPLLYFDENLSTFRVHAASLIEHLKLPRQLSADDLKFGEASLQHQAPRGLTLPTAVRDLFEALCARSVSSFPTPLKIPKSPDL
ncbi:sulfotransferase [Synechococcus sp. KORDI-100]|uniref:sulfotransferase n=1 Tax=Synechococcus sp. KORDI-100 TaxID=1280380 RepID=UPI00210074DF|nr:sulfotransferase [Synechococcus sp. KORDI-100]